MPTELAPDDIAGKVIRIIAEKQRISPETIKLDSSFEELKIDSLDGINIVFAIEEEFNISVPDEGVQTLRTVRQMVDGVRRLMGTRDPESSSAAGLA